LPLHQIRPWPPAKSEFLSDDAGDTITLGIYEKALPVLPDWSARLGTAADAGYRFIEISVDDDPRRLARLDWPATSRQALRKQAESKGVPVNAIVLSAHRRYPLGSASPETRAFAGQILNKAIDLAGDIGARVVQMAGYFVFFERRTPRSRDWFVDGVRKGADHAASAGVLLGLENMDGNDIISVSDAMTIVAEIDHPSLQVYPDVGNLSANGLDAAAELSAAKGHLAGIHLKDTRPGEFRRVAFGSGTVPFVEIFRTVNEIGYDGNSLFKMWNNGHANAGSTIRHARKWILDRMTEAEVKAT